MNALIYILHVPKKKVIDMIPKEVYSRIGHTNLMNKYKAIGVDARDWTTCDNHSRQWLKTNGYT